MTRGCVDISPQGLDIFAPYTFLPIIPAMTCLIIFKSFYTLRTYFDICQSKNVKMEE